MIYRTVAGLWIVLAFLGLIDAGYITVKYYTGGDIACPITGGCSDVLTSTYSQIAGFPVSLYGLAFYLTVLIIAFLYLDTGKRLPVDKTSWIETAMPILGLTGFLFTLWFVYLQIFVIGAICFYCMVSAILSTTIFGLAVTAFIKTRSSVLLTR